MESKALSTLSLLGFGTFLLTLYFQMGTALEALKGIGVIHADLHLHNVMIENHQTRPFRVKLIDFGVAMSRSEASQGKHLQPLAFR